MLAHHVASRAIDVLMFHMAHANACTVAAAALVRQQHQQIQQGCDFLRRKFVPQNPLLNVMQESCPILDANAMPQATSGIV